MAMKEFVTSAAGGRRSHAIIMGWLAPLVLGFFVFAVAILPSIGDTRPIVHVRKVIGLLNVNEFVFAFIALTALAIFLFLNRGFLYKLLEGENWPWFLREWRRQRAHVPHWRYVRAKQQHSRAVSVTEQRRHEREDAERRGVSKEILDRLQEEVNRAEVVQLHTLNCLESAAKRRHYRDRRYKYGMKWLEWLPRRGRPLLTPLDSSHKSPDWIPVYPEDEAEIMPTRIGNELRAMETFGYATYGLDSQTLWYELYSEAPEALREAMDEAELQADTYVASIYTAFALLVTGVATAVWYMIEVNATVGVWLAPSLIAILIPLLHRGLLAAIEEWRATIEALVVNGRRTLREKYGLRVPRNHEDERTMWQALTGFVQFGGDEYYAQQLDLFREGNAVTGREP